MKITIAAPITIHKRFVVCAVLVTAACSASMSAAVGADAGAGSVTACAYTGAAKNSVVASVVPASKAEVVAVRT